MEHRRFARIDFVKDCQVRVDHHACDATLLDLSIKGALVSMPCSVEMQQLVDLVFPLSTALVLNAKARVRYQQDDRVGLEFVDLPLDTATELRRLLELNLGDSNLVDREFHTLIESYTQDAP